MTEAAVKKKRGRPFMDPDSDTVRITLRMTEKMLDFVNDYAERRGESPSKFLRFLIERERILQERRAK